jgi:diguanylate cyclase (GGDEF)-like protein/PAS domain S-box-containing protein
MGVRSDSGWFGRRWPVLLGVLLFLCAAVASVVIELGSRAALFLRTGLLALAAALLVSVVLASNRLSRQRHVVRRRETMLHAVAYATDRFVRASRWEEAVDDVLARLGEAVDASRAYLFENKLDERGRLVMDELFEWCALGVDPTIHLEDNHGWPYDEGYEHWTESLPLGEVMITTVDDAQGAEALDLEEEGIQSTVFVPVFAGDEWWGFMGFDDCDSPRDWEQADVDLLKVVASHLGTAIGGEHARRLQRAAETRYRALVEHIPAITYVDALDDEASTLYISPQVEGILGYETREWTQDDGLWTRILHEEDRERAIAENMRHNETQEPFNLEYRMIAKEGHIVWVRDVAVVVHDDAGRPMYSQGFIQDITPQKDAEEELAFLAYHDKRTGLPNRAMFEELLELSVARARRHEASVAVICLNVDDFKLVNDSLGHEVGDEVLLLLAERLREATRETDLVARMSGDQFLLLLADLERVDMGEMDGALLTVESVAGRVQESLRDPFVIRETELFLSASMGICVLPQHAQEPKGVMQGAEAAMHESKKAGRGEYAISSAGGVDSITKLSFVTRLRKAVDAQHWVLHYQPIVELGTGEVIGVESLVRWQDPAGELIPPNEFIPLAEEIGLIGAIGDWVLEEVARQDAQWREKGIELELSFNLSPRQLWQPDLARRLVSPLQAGGVNPRQVIVELTESSAVKDFDRWQYVLQDLHSHGLRLALDDFGTGYSSLARLRYLPIEILKIDRSFIGGLHRDAESASIVSAVIELGRGLGMTTLAEGIETEREWRFLSTQGCDHGQGFLFSRPVPGEEITRRIVSGELVLAGSRMPGRAVDRIHEVGR